MAQRGGNSNAYIIGGLVVAVAIIAYFVFGDGMAMFGGDATSVVVDPATPTGGETTGGAAAPTAGGEAAAPASGGDAAPADGAASGGTTAPAGVD